MQSISFVKQSTLTYIDQSERAHWRNCFIIINNQYYNLHAKVVCDVEGEYTHATHRAVVVQMTGSFANCSKTVVVHIFHTRVHICQVVSVCKYKFHWCINLFVVIHV